MWCALTGLENKLCDKRSRIIGELIALALFFLPEQENKALLVNKQGQSKTQTLEEKPKKGRTNVVHRIQETEPLRVSHVSSTEATLMLSTEQIEKKRKKRSDKTKDERKEKKANNFLFSINGKGQFTKEQRGKW